MLHVSLALIHAHLPISDNLSHTITSPLTGVLVLKVLFWEPFVDLLHGLPSPGKFFCFTHASIIPAIGCTIRISCGLNCHSRFSDRLGVCNFPWTLQSCETWNVWCKNLQWHHILLFKPQFSPLFVFVCLQVGQCTPQALLEFRMIPSLSLCLYCVP